MAVREWHPQALSPLVEGVRRRGRATPRRPGRSRTPSACAAIRDSAAELQFDGWARRNPTGQFLWDLLFYEPWFLGLGILVSLGAVHHHRRTGGSARGARRLLTATALATLAMTAYACALVVARS
jgi:hypothetical protein